MDLTDIRTYCASLKGTWEDFPFDDSALVFKVGKKMYALAPTKGDLSISLKCDPVHAEKLREDFDAVSPGYHFNKRHWNTVIIDGSIKKDIIEKWILDSYNLVVKSMSKKEREEYDL
jgi:predicted DNA-binding protein (MmcQ/YjbR family)